MGGLTSVGVDDDLTPCESSISMGTADDELTRGVD